MNSGQGTSGLGCSGEVFYLHHTKTTTGSLTILSTCLIQSPVGPPDLAASDRTRAEYNVLMLFRLRKVADLDRWLHALYSCHYRQVQPQLHTETCCRRGHCLSSTNKVYAEWGSNVICDTIDYAWVALCCKSRWPNHVQLCPCGAI